MVTVNWTDVLNETGLENVKGFCNGTVSRRKFESFGTLARQTVRLLGTSEARKRARRALRQRNVSV